MKIIISIVLLASLVMFFVFTNEAQQPLKSTLSVAAIANKMHTQFLDNTKSNRSTTSLAHDQQTQIPQNELHTLIMGNIRKSNNVKQFDMSIVKLNSQLDKTYDDFEFLLSASNQMTDSQISGALDLVKFLDFSEDQKKALYKVYLKSVNDLDNKLKNGDLSFVVALQLLNEIAPSAETEKAFFDLAGKEDLSRESLFALMVTGREFIPEKKLKCHLFESILENNQVYPECLKI